MDLYDAVDGAKKLTAPGVDLFTYEHLKLFMGTGFFKNQFERNDKDEQQFTANYATLINLMLQGKLPEGAACFFRTNYLIALPKNETDIRPIGMGTLMRKITSKFVDQAATRLYNDNHFAPLQLGLKRAGMEEIIHRINLFTSNHNDYDMTQITPLMLSIALVASTTFVWSSLRPFILCVRCILILQIRFSVTTGKSK